MQVLAPLLRVVLAVCAALPRSQEVAAQVKEFVDTHHRALLRILADRSHLLQKEDLVELELAASLVGRVYGGPIVHVDG